jgi:hypothetical protein
VDRCNSDCFDWRPSSFSHHFVYLDDNGNPTTVVPPVKEWDKYGHPIIPARPDLSKISNGQLEKYRQTASRVITKYWEIQSARALAEPVIGYPILFAILPWIGRGFRSAQI